MVHLVVVGRRRRWPKGTWMRLMSGGILRAFMGKRGLSERTLARYAGCSRAMISHLLHERKTTCSPELAVRIAEALDCPLEALFEPRMSTQGSRTGSRKVAAA